MNSASIRTTIAETVKQHPIAFAYLVGSYARNRATPRSDVDVAVYPDDRKPSSIDMISDITTRLQGVLKPLDVDVIDLRRTGIPVLRSIMKHASPIVVRDANKERLFRRSVFQRSIDFQPTLALIGERTIEHIHQNTLS